MSLYFTILGIFIFTTSVLYLTVQIWERKVFDCLSNPVYRLTCFLFIFFGAYVSFSILTGFYCLLIESELHFPKSSIPFWILSALLISFDSKERIFVIDISSWKLTIEHNNKTEEINFVGTNEKAFARLYKEIEKTCHLYDCKLEGTTSSELIEKFYYHEVWLLGFEGELYSDTEYFEFKVEKIDNLKPKLWNYWR